MDATVMKQENVQVLPGAKDWQEAIRLSVKPLADHGYVESRYADEIISNTEKLGPYYLIAPGVAMPHARPEQGVLETQFSATLFQKPVRFEGKPEGARLFIVLAAADNEKHLQALTEIAGLLGDEDTIASMCAVDTPQDLYEQLQRG